jgi:hypothetical protein
VLRSGVGRRVGRAHVNEGLDRTDVDDPAPGRAELFQKGMCHVEHAMKVDRHDILLVLDHGLGIRGEGLAPVDAGIVDQDRDLAFAAKACRIMPLAGRGEVLLHHATCLTLWVSN